MKKLGLILVVLVIVTMLLVSCGSSDAECKLAKQQMQEPYQYGEPLDGLTVRLILNSEHAPDTVGYVLKECIERGWDYR